MVLLDENKNSNEITSHYQDGNDRIREIKKCIRYDYDCLKESEGK
jgi:hypothetical protein